MSEIREEKVNYAEELRKGLEENDLPFTYKSLEGKTVFTLPMAADNAPGITVKLIIDDDGDCKLRSYLASRVPKAKWANMLHTINDLNAKYRYICISLDRDGDICAAYDFQVHVGSVPIFAQIIAMQFLYTDIADKCIPNIMRTLWAEEAPKEKSGTCTIKANLFEEGGDDE